MTSGNPFAILGQGSGRGGRRLLEEAAVILSPQDNVAVAREDLAQGCEIVCPWGAFVLHDAIPAGHKLALSAIPTGTAVKKYGYTIGFTTAALEAGAWVHTHNLAMDHDLERAEFSVEVSAMPEWPAGLPRTFRGYRRPDGRVGTRNYIVVAAASNCSSHVCTRIADELREEQGPEFDGVVALPHAEGCAHHEGPDTAQLERTIGGAMSHPNVAAILMVGLGCEVNQIARYLGPSAQTIGDSAISAFNIQEAGGTLQSVREGVRRVREMRGGLEGMLRSEEPVSELVVGLNCGGSDAFSGISANPALGYASDLIVAAGGTVVLAETPEIYGAEHVLTRRAADPETGRRLIFIIRRFEEYFERYGATMDSNPAPGNRRGGITNIVEKSLGAVMKAGSSPMTCVLDYAARIRSRGLVVMDTPGYDPVSLTGIAAGGCNLIAFTTGRGSAIGFPTVPVLKIASNSRTFRIMGDNMDVNAGEIVDGTATIREKGREIYERLLRTASGERTRSEILGHREFVPWRIGPVV